jgi:hypothetical protein
MQIRQSVRDREMLVQLEVEVIDEARGTMVRTYIVSANQVTEA